MTVVVTHTTPADSSFSTEGAAAWNANHTLTGVGTMAEQDANNVAVTGGSINGTTIGFTTASTGKFSDLTDTSLTAGRVTYAGTGGNLVDSASLTFDGTTLTTNQLTANGQAQFGRSSANYFQATGGATTKAIEFRAFGSDTNVAMALRSQGTGAINLAPGSSGVNISNGGTVTAITRTATGTQLWVGTNPTATISAPTTAGGVQATVIPNGYAASATIQAGGTGYTVGDTLTLVGGAGGPATFTVSAVSAGVVTAVTALNFAQYSTVPTNPVSVTGGTGAGCTLNVSYGVGTSFTITNAGSGYVEQPTVTFSGGGGSGAAAYATVGSGTTVKSIGSTLDFLTPNAGIGLRVYDAGGGGTGYWRFAAGFAATATQIASSAGGNIATGGAASLNLQTNTSTTQAVVAHTASAVNFVQVTGGSTGNNGIISTAGSDTNVGLTMQTKGVGGYAFFTGGGRQVDITNTASAVNRLQFTGSAAGAAPNISAQGSDTNINLALTPKGTGRVQFGTYTATVSSITGYIEILDAGGTVRRLAVVA